MFDVKVDDMRDSKGVSLELDQKEVFVNRVRVAYVNASTRGESIMWLPAKNYEHNAAGLKLKPADFDAIQAQVKTILGKNNEPARSNPGKE